MHPTGFVSRSGVQPAPPCRSRALPSTAAPEAGWLLLADYSLVIACDRLFQLDQLAALWWPCIVVSRMSACAPSSLSVGVSTDRARGSNFPVLGAPYFVTKFGAFPVLFHHAHIWAHLDRQVPILFRRYPAAGAVETCTCCARGYIPTDDEDGLPVELYCSCEAGQAREWGEATD